jgi:hypothetical protein
MSGLASDQITTSIQEKVGAEGDEQTITVESFTGVTAPAGAKDIVMTQEDGKYVLRYTIVVSGSATTYQITGSTSQEPLATHAMFKSTGDYPVTDDEWKKWKIWDADPHDVDLGGWKPDDTSTSDGMKKYYAYRNKGIEDYLLGTVTMRVTSEQQNSPTLSGLGRIETPPNAPTLEDNKNWLCVGVDAERTAYGYTLWKVTREYRASAAGGWDPDIYSTA